MHTACNTFTWIDGNTYTSSNTSATHTISGGAANGCDSVITLDLTINNTVNSTDVHTACNTFDWIDGNTYTSSNTSATHTISGGAANGCDSVITLDLTINNTVNSTDVHTACNTFTWIDGNTYTSSNTSATHTISGGAANGCDSVITLDLTINNTVNSTDVHTACNTFDWIDGNTYTSSNTSATHTISGGAANGCDSVITLDLTINNTVNSTDVHTACNTFDWIDGNTYTSSNTSATHTISGGAANGCDSVITLDLTINNTVNSTDVHTACNTFTWIDGNTYTSSNTSATHTISGGAANGCDSVITLDLTINNTVNSTDVHTACNTFTWIDGNTYTSSNTSATHTISGGAANGCDSVITLDLTINNTVNSTDVHTACNTFDWIDGNTYTSNNSTAMHTITGGAANGCDSVITLDLTINNTVNSTDVHTACNTFTWIDGNTYTSSNTSATHTISGGAANGCDSVITLDLTINNTVNSTDVHTACNTFTWIDGNTYTSSNTSATHTISGGAANGCDSVITLDLTINNTVNSTDVHTACNTFDWIDGNTYTSSNTSATHTISGGAANGCDSVITLDLTINNTVNSTDVHTACNTFTWIDGNTYTSSNTSATHTISGGQLMVVIL
ncbi:MAG: hypothetical protein H6578_04090 [Chitinophagales bacterium]|nr:hypothetical protein [Chitinophagales bacterium]